MTKHKPEKGWLRALKRVAVGDDLRGLAQLDRIDEEGPYPALVYVRKSGKELRVSSAMIDRVWSATARGCTLRARTNGRTGISYTVAVEASVVAALGLVSCEITNRAGLVLGKGWRRGR